MPEKLLMEIQNCSPVSVDSIPVLEATAFAGALKGSIGGGARISSLFCCQGRDGAQRLFAAMADPERGTIGVACTVVRDSFPSISAECPQAAVFEREIAEQWGLVPEGHPDLKPLRYHPRYGGGRDPSSGNPERIGPGDRIFHRVSGEEIHEVAVGPVHAGIIEPGHFRFQCHGEEVLGLEISLGYQHRGIERALIGGPRGNTIHLMETVAGDTSIGHSMAYCHLAEALSGAEVPPEAHRARAVMLELERIANHTGDLGALANDIAYLPTASYCGRIRGDYLNMTALICGNRFGRNILVPGGVLQEIDGKMRSELLRRLQEAFRDTAGAAGLLWDSSSVLGRFEDCGRLDPEVCVQLGIVGPPARACGIMDDARSDFPSGAYLANQMPVACSSRCDVFARAYVRWLEIGHSVDLIRRLLQGETGGKICGKVPRMQSDSIAVSLVEGWRGEICHTAVTGPDGTFISYKIVDPSFHNWPALEYVMRNEEISNFPLCNKSFNLSYCGNDL